MRQHLASAILFLSALPLQAQTSGWSELGGSASGGGVSATPLGTSGYCDVAVGPDGYPAVVWLESPPQQGPFIYFSRWNGSTWAGLGGSDFGEGIIGRVTGMTVRPQVRIDASGTPFVALNKGGILTGDVVLLTWSGSGWVGIGGSDLDGGISQTNNGVNYHSLALDATGKPAVAWTTGSSRVYFRHWNGNAWIDLGDSGTTGLGGPNAASYPCLALDSLDRPWIAWTGGFFIVNDVYLRRWDPGSATWIELGGSGSGGGISNSAKVIAQASFALDLDDHPMLAWTDYASSVLKVYAKTWTGSAWAELGGSATGDGVGLCGGFPALARGANGRPVLAYPAKNADTTLDIRVKTWTGSSWSGLAGSDGEGGISSAAETSAAPAIAVGSSGTIAVAWEEGTGPDSEIWLRTCDPLSASGFRQFEEGGQIPIPAGGAIAGTTVVLKAALASLAPSTSLVFEVQARSIGDALVAATPIAASGPVASGHDATVTLAGLAPGSWHWRGRVNDGTKTGPWISFGGNAESGADFILGVAGAGGPPPESGGGGGKKCSAGDLAGTPVLLGLLLLAFLRR